MNKLFLSTLTLVTAFTLTAGTGLAYGSHDYRPDKKSKKDSAPEIKVESKNQSTVKNTVKAESNTGDNEIKLYDGKETKSKKKYDRRSKYSKPEGVEAEIETGDADAFADTTVYVGENQTKVKAPKKGKLEVESSNYSYVDNYVKAEANSGYNSIHGNVGDAEIKTGDAYASSEAFVVVGSNVTKIK
jgi:hypothetical protein